MSGNIEVTRPLKVRSKSVRVVGVSSGVGAGKKWKSLPCVYIRAGEKGGGREEGVLHRKPTRPKILRKTWDKVKGIIHPSGDGKGSSAPATPLKGEAKFFEQDAGDDSSRERIARNYALLQKRLSQEFRQSSLKGKSTTFGGEFTDEFKRKLFEWESHPSKRKGKGVQKEACPAVALNSRHLKELAWLDNQLQVIEAEKKRLEEELKKQEQREIRILKMKNALSVSDRVYNIRTDNGIKFRVEPFSSEYAMKVYEWEEKRGIGVEMSALGFFSEKYRDDKEDGGEGSSARIKKEEEVKAEASVEEKEDDVVGPLDLINERLKNSEGDVEGLAEKGARLLEDCIALGNEAAGGVGGDGRISQFGTDSTDCSVCSADESLGTKNNSGASNTDSDLYDKRLTIARRRSSCCGSSRGSPDRLSAFSSEDEKVVEEEKKDCLVGKVCVKQIVISGDEGEGGGFSHVFVPTARTIFSPVVEDFCGGSEEVRAGPKIVGEVKKPSSVAYKPMPKTQLLRQFPGNSVYCSPMAARRAFGDERVVRKLPPRTNVNVPRKYTIGGGIPPCYARECVIARSNSFQFRGVDGEGRREEAGSGREGFSQISKSKSTGSIKRSIASVKCFLGFGGKEKEGEGQDGGGSSERRGSRGRWKFWGGKGKDGE